VKVRDRYRFHKLISLATSSLTTFFFGLTAKCELAREEEEINERLSGQSRKKSSPRELYEKIINLLLFLYFDNRDSNGISIPVLYKTERGELF
jgi:hypothetical protein